MSTTSFASTRRLDTDHLPQKQSDAQATFSLFLGVLTVVVLLFVLPLFLAA